MSRTRLPNRRSGLTIPVKHADGEYLVTYNFIADSSGAARICECFCSIQASTTAPKLGSDIRAIIEDACKAISKLLQRGESISEVAKSFGENRPEGESSGPPSSLLGAIARAGAELEDWVSRPG